MVVRLLGVFFCGFFLLTPDANAQNRVSRLMSGQSGASRTRMQQATDPSMMGAFIVAEGAIDTQQYIVGPGDQFSIFIGGAIPTQLFSPVSAEGNLMLFDAGSIDASGKTLAGVREEALAALRGQYRNVSLEVHLVQPRQFFVHVSGVVPEPGRYVMPSLSRLDDAVQQAFAARASARPDPTANNEVRIVGSSTAEIPSTQQGFEPSLRNVLLIRRDSSRHSYDLFRYYTNGDLEHNPYLQDGDVIQLGSYHEVRDGILVTGDVAKPGRIEFRPGDTVVDVLRLVAGDRDLSSLGTVRHTRRTATGVAPPTNLNIGDLLSGAAPAPAVARGDHLNVEMKEAATASIFGFVQFPGTYPIENARTTLRQLLELGGGLKEEASVRSAYLERRRSLASRPNSNASDLDFFGRAYYRESLSENRVSINIESALQNAENDIVLYDGDVVVFPRDEQTIYVSGNVINPGYIPYSENKTARYYIDQAGGEAPLTTGIYVFEAGTGQVSTDAGTVLRPGDTIFLNREAVTANPELQALLITDQVSKRQTRIATTQTIITGVTALVSIVNTFLLIRDRLNN